MNRYFFIEPSYPVTVTRSPGTAPSGGARISTLSGVEAHMTIASDTIPRILAGFKLHKSTTMRFCISSKGMCRTRPEITWRGFSLKVKNYLNLVNRKNDNVAFLLKSSTPRMSDGTQESHLV